MERTIEDLRAEVIKELLTLTPAELEVFTVYAKFLQWEKEIGAKADEATHRYINEMTSAAAASQDFSAVIEYIKSKQAG